MPSDITAFVVCWTVSEIARLNERGAATLVLVVCWIVDERYTALVVCWIVLEITVPGVDDKYTTLVVCWAILVVVHEITGWSTKSAGRICDCGHSVEPAVKSC